MVDVDAGRAARDADVEAILDKHVKAKSKETYYGPASRFLLYACANEVAAASESFRVAMAAADNEKARAALAKAWVKEKKQPAPLQFNLVTAPVIQRYLVGLRKKDGSKPGKSSYGTARSSVRFLFTTYKQLVPAEVDAALSVFMKGVKRDVVQRQKDGELRVQEGKEAFSFEQYQMVCKAMMALTGTEGPFLHLVHVLAWNLMCRVDNVFSIMLAHMAWVQDSLTVVFAQQKNDQDGDRPRDPRHLYANPDNPAICPLTALGIYWLTIGYEAGATSVFSGDLQYDRFSKGLKKVLKQPLVLAALAAVGLKPSDFGAHSDRKGGASFLAACQGGPGSISVCLRGGWSLTDIERRYFCFEAAQDCFVGRAIAGLSLNTYRFAILPPFWPASHLLLLDEAMAACFPSLPAGVTAIARMALASVVYHCEFLRANMPADHLLFSSPLFALGFADRLVPHVECRLERQGDVMRTTGIPPLVPILRQMEELRGTLAPLVEGMGNLASDVVKGVTQVLEERAVQAQAVTPAHLDERLDEKLMDVFRRTGVLDFIEKTKDGSLFAGAAPSSAPAAAPSQRAVQLHNWGGRFSKVPETFIVPKGSTYVAFQHWMFGSQEGGYPALRTVQPIDIPTKQKERFSHLRWLMGEVESEAKRAKVWVDSPTVEQATEVFQATMPHLGLPTKSPKGRKRRMQDLNWGTVVNSLRSVRRNVRGIGDDDLDDEGSE